MTQQPFSRPGAIDLSGLRQQPAAGSPPPGAAGPGGAAGAAGGATSAYALTVTEQNFQATVEASMTAPVLLVFYSRTRMPESGQLADDLVTVVEEHEGRYLLGLVDIDAAPQIAHAAFSGRAAPTLAVGTASLTTPVDVGATSACTTGFLSKGARVSITGFTDSGLANTEYVYTLTRGTTQVDTETSTSRSVASVTSAPVTSTCRSLASAAMSVLRRTPCLLPASSKVMIRRCPICTISV